MEAPFSSFPPYTKKDDTVEAVTDLIVLSVIFLFLFSYFRPEYLLSGTVTTGGDTASHFFTAQYLRDYLLPGGKISGWCPGNLAGFPMLQNYFPLSFFLMALLSWIIPLTISFKLITVLGTFLLPVCTYLFFRFLRQPFPVPVISAIFTLPFLFNQGNTMWGGNIPSTLAGTFSYSLGLSLSVLWLGLMYRAFYEGKGIVAPSALLALVGFGHGYTLLFSLFAGLYFLRGGFRKNLKKLILIYALTFCLMAFWLIPLLAFWPYTTGIGHVWMFYDWAQFRKEIFPVIFHPFMGLSVFTAVFFTCRRFIKGRSRRFSVTSLLWYLSAAGVVLYSIGYRIGVADVRFIPFFHFYLLLCGVPLFALLPIPGSAKKILCGVLILATLLWVDSRVTFIEGWIRSNYAGFEKTRLWSAYSSVNQLIKGSPGDPRVAYENTLVNAKAGTPRAFESIPLFAGRSTLEGVYTQASLSVPFIFYIQSEISQRPSTPLAEYNYSRFDLTRGIEHLKLFNVRELILVEPESREAAAAHPELRLKARFEPYEVYEITSNGNRYVEPLKYRPVAVSGRDFRKTAYRWFRLGDLEVPLVFLDPGKAPDRDRFQVVDDLDVRNLPRNPVERASGIRETVNEEEIIIEGASPGKPLMVKVSYHPNWRVEGADRIYPVSPSFMLIYPDSSRVRLHYGGTWPDKTGAGLTVSALILIMLSRFPAFTSIRRIADRWYSRWGFKIAVAAMAALGLAMLYFVIRVSPDYPSISYERGLESYRKDDFSEARIWFRKVMDEHPQTLAVDYAGYFYAVTFYRENDWDNTIHWFQWLLENYPESRMAAEACYYIGFCQLKAGRLIEAREAFHRTMKHFPGTIWAGHARDRLKELPAS